MSEAAGRGRSSEVRSGSPYLVLRERERRTRSDGGTAVGAGAARSHELGWERRFRGWCGARGIEFSVERYDRAQAGGETLALRLRPAAASRGRVVVTHGAGNDALFGMVSLFRRLLEGGYEVFSFELDGHGREGETRFEAAHASGSVAAALEQAAVGDGDVAPRTHLVGISLGGAVMLHALPEVQHRVVSAALFCAPLQIRFGARSVLGELRPVAFRTVLRERDAYGLTGLVPSFGPFKRSIYPLRLASPPGPGAFGYIEALNREISRMELEAAAAAVSVPVLLVYGTRDRVVPFSQAERLARVLPRAELLPLLGETHLTTPMNGFGTERLLDWLARHG